MAGIITAAVVGVAATGYSLYEKDRARSKQKRANKKAERIEAIQAQRSRVQAIRQNRIQASQVTASAGNSGLLGSSGVQGSLAGLASEAAANLSFTNQIDALNTQRQGLLNRAGQNIANADISDSILGLAVQTAGVL